MKALNVQKLREEPLNSAIVAGFSTLCAIAFVNLLGNLFSHSSAISGALILFSAIAASIFSGALASFRSKKLIAQRQIELKIARSLASGDFSNAVWQAQHGHSELASAMSGIADRQLAIERNNGQLIQEAVTRESQLLSALDCIGLEITIFDRGGLLVCANTAYLSRCNMIGAAVALGMTRKEVWAELAKAPRSNLPLNERQSWLKFQEELRAEALSTKAPVRFGRFNGEPAHMFVYTTRDGHHVEIIESIEDRINLEQRVQRAEREADAMGRIKQVTLSRLSHTIRTPMTGVLAAADLLSESVLDEKQRGRVEIIRRSAGTLLGVVQDMFEMAETTLSSDVTIPKIDAAQRKQALVCSTPAHLAKEVIELLGKDEYEITSFEPFGLSSDAGDALKLANEKHADLIVLANEDQKAGILAIKDFTDLSQKPELKLFSDLLRHSETADVVHNPAEGNMAAEGTMNATVQSAKPAQRVDLLVVESNEVNQIYLSNSLDKSDFAFNIVGTGALAIEAAKVGKPRLILMDISIPDIDGLQVTASIRASTAGDALPPVIIGMTNHFVQGDLAKCIAAGMDHYQAKPQTAENLHDLVARWLKTEPLRKAS
jgi:CheY-like chemotaxis protein/signal transduction histidine kinase